MEHLYLTDLGPGVYTLRVSTESARDYGLAWRVGTLFDVPSADFDEDGQVGGADFLTWQHHYGMLLGATHAMGDSDGDGDVDADDLDAFQSIFGASPIFSGFVSVPEPRTIGLALLLAILLWPWHRRSRVSQ